MDGIRFVSAGDVDPSMVCCRCAAGEKSWDRIAGKAYCPKCLESLAQGEADALIEPVQNLRCAVCFHLGSVTYLTFPLRKNRPVEMDLCVVHLRSLISRCLGPHAFEQLRRLLLGCGLKTENIFLLHSEFYDARGKALRPAIP